MIADQDRSHKSRLHKSAQGIVWLLCLLPLVAHPRPADNSPIRATPIGETLVFQIEWSPPWYLFFLPVMDAGEVEITLADEARYHGKEALQIVFKARSSGTFARLVGIKVDDRYEFLTDPETLCTFSAAKRIRQGKRRRDIDVVYQREDQRLHFREVDVATDPPEVKKDEYVENIPACVQDPFSALYSLRRENFTAGATFNSLIGNDQRIKDVVSRVERREITDTPLGKYDVWKIETKALLGGLFKHGGQFRIWLTADEEKIPVLFEARVQLGSVVGKIRRIEKQRAAESGAPDRVEGDSDDLLVRPPTSADSSLSNSEPGGKDQSRP